MVIRQPLALGFLAFFLGFSAPSARCQDNSDPYRNIVGEWRLPGTVTTIEIAKSHAVRHSELGSGDIKFDNVDLFVIRYLHRHLTCHYKMTRSRDELWAEPSNQTDDPICILGTLKLVPPPEPEQEQAGKQGEKQAGQAGAKENEPAEKQAGEQAAKPKEQGETQPQQRFEAEQILKECEQCPEMAVLPAGFFKMGSPEGESGRDKDEGPQHIVSFGQPFAVSRYAVTKKEFQAFVDEEKYKVGESCNIFSGNHWEDVRGYSYVNPGFPQGDDNPVVCVNWNDAQAYADWLKEKTGKPYRLLTEAEREYAARAGTETPYWFGSTIPANMANFDPGDAAKGTWLVPVGKATLDVHYFTPNKWKLYQVHGNVTEWVQDCWSDTYVAAPSDGSANLSGDCSKRVLRGGAFGYPASRLRSASRESAPAANRYFHVGFRVARSQ